MKRVRLPAMRTSLQRMFEAPPRRRAANITEVFRRLDGLAKVNFSSFAFFDPVCDERLARAIAADAMWIVESYEGKVDANWYSRSLDEAVAIASTLHPELVDDDVAASTGVFATAGEARVVFLAALAITSQGVPVQSNAVFAIEQYRCFLASGRFVPRSMGPSGASIENNLHRLNDLVDLVDGDISALADFLEAEFTVGEIRQHAQENGLSLSLAGRADQVTWGSIVFGPKIGAFMQNLLGNEKALTVDMWLMRTFGRLTGTNMNVSVPDATLKRAVATLKAALRDGDELARAALDGCDPDTIPAMSISELASLSRRLVRQWNGFRQKLAAAEGNEVAAQRKAKMGWPFAVQALEKQAAMPVDAPETARRRLWMNAVMDRATDIMRGYGHDISVSGLQAVLWYPEKQLVSALTGRKDTSLNISFSEAFEIVATKEGVDHERIAEARAAPCGRGRGAGCCPEGTEPRPDGDQAFHERSSRYVPVATGP